MVKLKQVIIVRKDLKIGKGKLAASVAHASVESLFLAKKEVIEKWRKEGAKKVVLKVENLEELEKIVKKLRKEKIKFALIKDAGLTQLKKGTITALGIGPIEEKKIDKITGKLKLL
jgi:PTH2 family peptidyl-tRNA hydrolase